MDIEKTEVGVTRGHKGQDPQMVHAYTLDAGGRLTMTVWTYGASLMRVDAACRDGGTHNLVVSWPALRAHERRAGRAYLGATMGRYARCISEGRCRIAGRAVHLRPNYGSHHFHGGPFGFDAFVWEAESEVGADFCAVRMKLSRPDGDMGYPGRIDAETVYRLTIDDSISFDHSASSTAVTLCDMTNHAMWNLAGGRVVDTHLLRLNASRVIPVNDELIPVGRPENVDGTDLDFRLKRALGGTRLDHCFVPDGSQPLAWLEDPTTGRAMSVHSHQPGLQVYTADAFVRPRAGICIQTGSWPDAPNHPDFPSVLLEPGEVYRHKTTHRFHGL